MDNFVKSISEPVKPSIPIVQIISEKDRLENLNLRKKLEMSYFVFQSYKRTFGSFR